MWYYACYSHEEPGLYGVWWQNIIIDKPYKAIEVYYQFLTITVEAHLSGPYLSRLFTYQDTCLGTNPHSSTESDSLIQNFSYPDSQSENGGVRISELPL